MFIRILFLAVFSLQVSGCIATPRFTKKVSEDYEPPKKTDEIAVQENTKPQLSEQAKEEIRRQVREELRLQQEANSGSSVSPAPAQRNLPFPPAKSSTTTKTP